VRQAALSVVRCRSPTCPRAGIAATAPGSSIRRPIIRSARWPRRHRPSRSADAGSCSRPAEIGCAGRSRSCCGPHCAAAVPARRRSRDKAKMGAMSASWAVCDHICECRRGSQARNRSRLTFAPHLEKYRMVLLHATKVRWTVAPSAVSFSMTPACQESLGVELGPLPLPVLGAWGKEPT
jgi:hypothetical protein